MSGPVPPRARTLRQIADSMASKALQHQSQAPLRKVAKHRTQKANQNLNPSSERSRNRR